MNATKVKAELTRLHSLLRKYRHRWVTYKNGQQQEASNRIYNWIFKYNEIKRTMPKVFSEWCDENGKVWHDAYDVMA